jgi:hypothetical protein
VELNLGASWRMRPVLKSFGSCDRKGSGMADILAHDSPG